MTIFLERLPLEIRRQIYKELLTSKGNAIRLTIEPLNDKNSTKIHSAVFCTCKQIYDEASIVLLEHNRFRYASHSSTWLSSLENDPGYKSVNRIKHLDLIHCGEMEGSIYRESRDEIHGFLNKLMTIMRFLINAGCSLQTLGLQFSFYDLSIVSQPLPRYGEWPIIEAVKAFHYPDSTGEAMQSPYDPNKRNLTLNSFREESRSTIEEFANRVNMAKERALMVDVGKGSIKEDGELLDMWTKFGQIDSQIESRYIGETYHYRWTWTLRPLTSVTKRFPTPWQLEGETA